MKLNFFFYRFLGYAAKLKFALSEHLTEILDRLLHPFLKCDRLISNENNKNKILVIGKEFNFRAYKYAKLLSKESRFEIILACHRFSKLNGELKNGSFKIVRFRNLFHLKLLLQKSNMDVAIAFTSVVKYAECTMRFFPGKKIFDPYDCLTIYYGVNPHLKWMRSEVKSEIFCLEHCDGILARNLEVKYAAKIANVKHVKKNILFSDYCDPENFIFPDKKMLSKENVISLVYSGGLYGKNAQKSAQGITNFQPLVESLTVTGLHLHLYPLPNAPYEFYYEFIEEAKINPNLFMHDSVKNSVLSKELSQYNFGILPHFKEPGHPILTEKLNYATSNKFFNFLEAGIPVIVSEELKYMAWITSRYKIGIVISRDDLFRLNEIISTCDYASLASNVLKVRDKLSINKNINRLINFLEKI